MTEHINKFYALYGETIAKEGIAAIPIALFRYQRELNLSFQELALVCHLLSYRWTANNPHPSIETLSKITGISAKTIHQYKNNLIRNGNLKVKNRYSSAGGQLTNEYDLTPLFAKLQILVEKADQSHELPSLTNGCVDSTHSPVKAEEGCVNFTPSPMKGVKNLQRGDEESTHPPVKNLHTPCEEGFIGGMNTGSYEVNNINKKDKRFTVRTVDTGGDNVTLSSISETNGNYVTNNLIDDSFVLDDIFTASLEVAPPEDTKSILDTGDTKNSLDTKEIPFEDTKRILDTGGAPDFSMVRPEGKPDFSMVRPETAAEKNAVPTNRDLIVELARKLNAIPYIDTDVREQNSRYSIVGKAYKRYGYQAVAEAIEDLALDIIGMHDSKVFEGTIPKKELTQMFFAWCKRNYKPPQEGEKLRTGPKKKMTRELALAMGCIHDPENNRIIVTPEARENLRRARAAGEI